MKHLEVVAGIIIFEGKILCMKRNKGNYDYISYKYEFPGGKIEPGETQIEALKRELKEEMNLEVVLTEEDYFLTVEHEYPDFAITMHCYICKTYSPHFERREHVDHIWLKHNELHQLDWAPADEPIVRKIEIVEI